MNALNPVGPATLADVIARLEANSRLAAVERRDLISAVNRAAALIGYSAADLPANLPLVRDKLLKVHPAKAGIRPKTLANIKSSLGRAFRITRAVPRSYPPTALTDAWQAFLQHANAKHQAHVLARLARFCCHRKIEPSAVLDEVLAAFQSRLHETLLTKDPKAVVKDVAQTWNGIIKRNRLNYPLLTIPKADKYRAAPLESYPASLQADINSYLERLRHRNLFDDEGPAKPLREVSLRNITAHVRQFLDAAITAGRRAEEFQTLKDVVQLDIIKPAFRVICARNGGDIPVGLQNMAGTLSAIAKYYLKVSETDLQAIKDIKARTFKDLQGMSDKNAQRLAQFDDWENLGRLVNLPDRLVARAKKNPGSSRSGLDVMHATAISILLACPMRVKNLAGLDIEKNLRPTGAGVHTRYSVWIESSDVKNGVAIEIDLGPEASQMLRLYLSAYRPLVSTEPGTALFPKRSGGGPRSPANFGQHLQQVIYRETGLDVHPHLFRHIAAKLYLDKYPGEYETVRRLLGHKKLETTLSFYARFDTRAAQARYADVVLAARKRRGRR